MNFKGHLVGGLVAGVSIIGIAQYSDFLYLNTHAVDFFLQNPLNLEGDIAKAAGLFALTLFMSLFPDLDQTSIPQKWFFRVVFLLLVILFLINQLILFVIVTFFAIAPLLHKHRGWTHSWLTPFFISIFFAVLLEYFNSQASVIKSFSLDRIILLFQDYWIYFLGCILGHYTHLMLDLRK